MKNHEFMFDFGDRVVTPFGTGTISGCEFVGANRLFTFVKMDSGCEKRMTWKDMFVISKSSEDPGQRPGYIRKIQK